MATFEYSTAILWVMLLCLKTAKCTDLANVALSKPTEQSTTFPARYSWLAVDGSGDTSDASCTHTLIDSTDGWWQVDFQERFEIHAVVLTNRGDCCGYRLVNFYVEVFNQNPIQVPKAIKELCTFRGPPPIGQGLTERLNCSRPIIGRHVRVKRFDPPLTLCEVEVLAASSIQHMFNYHKDMKCSGDIIQEVTSPHHHKCLSLCMREPQCSAVNLGPIFNPSGTQTACQLLSYAGIGQSGTITAAEGWQCFVMM